jgi:predicted DNA-binding transcriptional regulator AlpA
MQLNTKRVLSFQDVATRLGVHVTTINRWCAAGTFVSKVRLSQKRVGFLTEDVDRWLEERRTEAA